MRLRVFLSEHVEKPKAPTSPTKGRWAPSFFDATSSLTGHASDPEESDWDVAQWKSAVLIRQVSRVRIPPSQLPHGLYAIRPAKPP